MKSLTTIVLALATLPTAFAQGSAIASAASSLLASAASSAVASRASSVASAASSAAASATSSASRASSSGSASGSAAAAVQTVAVGQNGLVFSPDSVTASVGSQIRFVFYPKNHSVAQSNFDSPCMPSANALYSGFVPVSNGTANQTFTITVQNTNPIWLYCSQNLPVRHCAMGMVMVINPPASGNTLAAYKAAATSQNQTAVSPSSGPAGGNLTSATPSSGSPTGSATGSARPSSSTTGGAMRFAVDAGSVAGLAVAVAALMW